MYYVLSTERDDWGNFNVFRRGKFYKNFESAKRLAIKYANADVYKYGNKVPVFTTNPKVKEIIDALRVDCTT